MMRALFRILGLFVSCGLSFSAASAATSIAVEYYHSAFGHYFMTASPREISALDAGTFPGWSRSGELFGVLELNSAGTANVCRFWSGQTYTPKSSHFYTALASECAIVMGSPDWLFEGAVFAMALSDDGGRCASGMSPLYRLYNNGQGGVPNHRYTTSPAIRAQMLAQGWIAEGVGNGVAGCVVTQEMIDGHVIDGYIANALVCLDQNGDGRCSDGEPQTYSDTSGSYHLTVPTGSTAPLLAEILAGQSRDSDDAHATVDVSFRMASPSRAYSTDITPFSTLVHLTTLSDYPLAEDLVRDMVGLPPKYDIKLSAAAPSGSLKQSVAKAIVTALKTNGWRLDLSAPDALASVIAAFPAALTELPQLHITTKDGAPILSKEVYVDATYVLRNPMTRDAGVPLNGKIRGRGHTTWGQPKNPYKVQFSNDASYAAIGDVLGMKKQRNWALLADYFDRSLMRNKLALSLGSSKVFSDGLKWTPSGQHVEVYLNDDYVGVYLLTEDIRIDPARLNLKKMSSSAGTSDVDGGYIVEVDVRLDCYNEGNLNLQLVTPFAVSFCIDTPDEESITINQLSYIKNLLLEVENDIYASNRLDRVNQESFVDWYLLQELFRNNDAIFVSSDYMWKDTDAATNPKDRLLNMGPLWDFDRSAGNVNYNENWNVEGCWVGKPYQPNWISRLFNNPQFVALTLSRWKQKRPALEVFLNVSIDTYSRRLAFAQQRNFQRWPIFGVPLTNYYVFSEHAEEVAFLRYFLNQRMVWLDKVYDSPGAFNALCR